MKKLLSLIMLLAATVNASAQIIAMNERGEYERKEVIEVQATTAATLYDRAMIALSEWTGPDGKAKAGVDYQNQETHTVIYKGTYYLGMRRFMLTGTERYANFTLKVRCKDGKAQIIINVPTIKAVFEKGMTRTYSINEVFEEQDKAGRKKNDRIDQLIDRLRTTADSIVEEMTERLKGASATDDDF